MALTDKLTAIANAIRAKTGKTDLLTLDDMPTEIENIKTGDTTIEDGLVSRTLTEYRNDRVTSVGDASFRSSAKLTSVSMQNVVTIGNEAFAYCTGLTSDGIRFPNATHLNGVPFGYCAFTEITDEMFPKFTTPSGYTFRNNTKLKKVKLSALTSLNGNGRMFYGCTALTTADFTNITRIVANAFNSNTTLETLILRNSSLVSLAVCDNNSVGSKIHGGTGYIYVPSALVEEYKSATNWSTYAEQIRAIEDYPEITGGV